MGIKYTYTCDFCGGCADDHKTLEDKRIICKDCLNHLEKQTWRLAEEPRELQKEKDKLEEERKELYKFVEEKRAEYAANKFMARRYRNVVYALLNLYNKIIYEVNEIIPKGFFSRRPSFKLIDIDKFKEKEKNAIDDVVREVERNYYNNFNYYECSHIDINERLEDLPMESLPWDDCD
jgi:hypothetical protein